MCRQSGFLIAECVERDELDSYTPLQNSNGTTNEGLDNLLSVGHSMALVRLFWSAWWRGV